MLADDPGGARLAREIRQNDDQRIVESWRLELSSYTRGRTPDWRCRNATRIGNRLRRDPAYACGWRGRSVNQED
jgi:hypothetical protein